jgi:hypothetical protein
MGLICKNKDFKKSLYSPQAFKVPKFAFQSENPLSGHPDSSAALNSILA